METEWSPQVALDCCEGIPGVADNHLSLRAAPDDRLLLIAKNDVGDGQLHLYIRSVAGVWGQETIVDPDPFAAATRPALVLDLSNDDAYVLYRDSIGMGSSSLFGRAYWNVRHLAIPVFLSTRTPAA